MAVTCPNCETSNNGPTRCIQCSTDLGPLVRVIAFPEELLSDGIALLEAGDVDTAMERFSAASALIPDSAPPHAAMARALLAKRLYDEALAHCDRALQIEPEFADVLALRRKVIEQRFLPEPPPLPEAERKPFLWIWILPVLAFAAGLAFMGYFRPVHVSLPEPPASERLLSRLRSLTATRDLHVGVTNQDGVLQVAGEVPSQMQLDLVKEIAMQESPGKVSFGGLRLAAAPGAIHYRIRGGDTLWLITRREYGAGSLWPQVAKVNHFSRNLRSLVPGGTLDLPTLTIQPR